MFDDPDLSAIAEDTSSTPVDQARFLTALVACVGPEPVIDKFMEGVASSTPPPTAAQQTCIRTELEGLGHDQGIAVVSGDLTAAKAFTAQIAKACQL